MKFIFLLFYFYAAHGFEERKIQDAREVLRSDFQVCQVQLKNAILPDKKEFIQPLEGFVGMGWDNLENAVRSFVLRPTYNECRTTSEGLYLIADQLEVFLNSHFHSFLGNSC